MGRIDICGEISYYFAKVRGGNTPLQRVTTLVIWVDVLYLSVLWQNRGKEGWLGWKIEVEATVRGSGDQDGSGGLFGLYL